MASYEQLYKFIRAAYINLKPGGYFCGIVSAYDERFPLEGELKTMKGNVTYYLGYYLWS